MTRTRVELTYITDPSKRKQTFRKRTTGLIKKIEELSVLCGIKSCAIVNMPTNPGPSIWPSEERAITVFSELQEMPEAEQTQKMLTQETFTRKMIAKAEKKLRNLEIENRKTEMKLHLAENYFNSGKDFDATSVIDPNDVSNLADENLEQPKRKILTRRAKKMTQVPENEGETMTLRKRKNK